MKIDEVVETPAARNSRPRYDEAAPDELAASNPAHGPLQPLLVRPLGQAEAPAPQGSAGSRPARPTW